MKCVQGRVSLPLVQVFPEITIKSQGAVFPSEELGGPSEVNKISRESLSTVM